MCVVGSAIQRGWHVAYAVFGTRDSVYSQDTIDLFLDGVGQIRWRGGFLQDPGAHFRGHDRFDRRWE